MLGHKVEKNRVLVIAWTSYADMFARMCVSGSMFCGPHRTFKQDSALLPCSQLIANTACRFKVVDRSHASNWCRLYAPFARLGRTPCLHSFVYHDAKSSVGPYLLDLTRDVSPYEDVCRVRVATPRVTNEITSAKVENADQ